MSRKLTPAELEAAGLNKPPEFSGDGEDWTRHEIRHALCEAGFTLAGLEREAGLYPGAVNQALTKRYPKVDRLIATVLKRGLHEIWPTRYFSSGASIQKSKRYSNADIAKVVRESQKKLGNIDRVIIGLDGSRTTIYKAQLPPGVGSPDPNQDGRDE